MAEASKRMQTLAQVSKAMATKKTTPNSGFTSAAIKKVKAGASNPPANVKNYAKYFN